jgi:hypothetical protein
MRRELRAKIGLRALAAVEGLAALFFLFLAVISSPFIGDSGIAKVVVKGFSVVALVVAALLAAASISAWRADKRWWQWQLGAGFAIAIVIAFAKVVNT